MKFVVPALFVLMLILHQDFWWWDDETLVFGFMPMALAFHAAFSIGCAILGFLAIRFMWPHEMEKRAEEPSEH